MKLNLLSLVLFFSINTLLGQSYLQLADINPGDASSGAFNDNASIYHDGVLYFSADDGTNGDELWIYDGSEVKLVKDINPGANGSEIQHMNVINGTLIFTADTEAYGTEWWTTDGTESGTQLFVDIDPGDSDGVFASYFDPGEGFATFNGELYFTGILDGDYELYKTDGSLGGTGLVKNIASFGSSFPNSFVEFENELYFTCREGFSKTDGTSSGTQVIRDEDPDDIFGFEPESLFATDDYILMIQGNNLWSSDGTNSGTRKIADFETINLSWGGPRFREVNGKVLFPADDGITGDELWTTNGTEGGTQLVIDLFPGEDGYAPQNTVIFKDKMYYKGDNGQTDIELYSTDGTAAGTQLVHEFSDNGSGFFLPSEIVADDNYIYMNAGKGFSKELWVSDGTSANTFEIKINPTDETRPNSFYLFDGKLFCFAYTDIGGYEPYIIDLSLVVIDQDGDGYAQEDDCDDSNDEVNPGQTEIPYNGIDDDCDAASLDDDLDGDGFNLAEDCDDDNPGINPAAEDLTTNGVDEDCDGVDFTSSVHTISDARISIYPNPANEFVKIDVEGSINYRVELFDLQGKLILSQVDIPSIDVSGIARGTYLLVISDTHSSQNIVERIVLAK